MNAPASHALSGASPVDVLLVSEGDGIGGFVESVLRTSNYSASTARDMHEALRRIQEQRPRVVIIPCDYVIPNGGLPFADMIGERCPDQEIVLLRSPSARGMGISRSTDRLFPVLQPVGQSDDVLRFLRELPALGGASLDS